MTASGTVPVPVLVCCVFLPPVFTGPNLEACEAMFSWFWYLLEDVSEQPLIIKGLIGLGWLSVLIMVTGMLSGVGIL